jgi:transposase
MYVATIPNRNSPPAILLRRGYREGGKAKTETIANITDWEPERIEALKRALRGEFDGIVDGVDPINERIFGVLYVLEKLADRIEITKALGKTRMGKLALFLVLARIADQGSRLSAVRWAKDHCVAEILGLTDLHTKELYLALDWLSAHQERIEKKLFKAYMKKKGCPLILVLYDATRAYLEGECNELGAFGYAPDGKKAKEQIVVGLLTAGDGEPLSVKVFEGNTADPSTIFDQIDVLKRRFGIEDVVFVGDRGMVKSKGKEALTENGLKYITALTDPQVRKLLAKDIIQLDLFDQTLCDIEHGHLRLVLYRNEKTRRKEERRRQDKLARLTEKVSERNAVVLQSKRAIPEAGLRKLRAWSKRHKISSFCELNLEDRLLVLTVDDKKKVKDAELDGCYVLETDVTKDKMDAKTVNERYRSLQMVERNFRTLKNGFLELRPIFVRKEERTEGHALCCMLALKIIREANLLLNGSCETPEDDSFQGGLQDALRTMSRWTLHHYKGQGIDFLRLPEMDDVQLAVCQTLAIDPPSKASSRRVMAEAR